MEHSKLMEQLHEDEGVFDMELEDPRQDFPQPHNHAAVEKPHQRTGGEDSAESMDEQYPSTPPPLIHTNDNDNHPTAYSPPPPSPPSHSPPKAPSTAPNHLTTSLESLLHPTAKYYLPSAPYVTFQTHHLALLSPTALRTDSELQARLFKSRVRDRKRNEGWGSFWSWSIDDIYGNIEVIDLGDLEGEPVMSGALEGEDGRCVVCAAREGGEGMVEVTEGNGGAGRTAADGGNSEAIEAIAEVGVVAL